ncbi:hypothetical protein AB0F17_35200 [Nonomuraea sp. NPDC026600]|uniref:hypothetical protein n=1 Tax=Nonomuraea sp. NPDC026600 TaxID=3155363 RepID=UPI0033EE93FB
MTDQDAKAAPPSEDTDPVLALARACERFAAHVSLLTDQMTAAELSLEDVGRVQHVVHRALAPAAPAAGLTTGLQRPTGGCTPSASTPSPT